MTCQACGGTALDPILDLGAHPPSDAFLSEDDLGRPEAHYPLRVVSCRDCLLVQLDRTADPHELFGERYVYQSGYSEPLRRHLQALAATLVQSFTLEPRDLAVDLGSNDGTLLLGYRPFGLRVLGVEPSGVGRVAEAQGIPTLRAFFNEAVADQIVARHGPASVVTATNVFAHVPDLQGFIRGVRRLLTKNGVFATESHYLLDMVQQLQYDEIYVEHLRYYSLQALVNLFRRFGLDVFHAERVTTHGGSIRTLVAAPGAHCIDSSVPALLAVEREARLHEPATFVAFRERIEANRQTLTRILDDMRAQGHRVVGIGAPAKGNTLLNYCRITPEQLDYIVEKSEAKVGKYAPGSRIRIVAETRLFQEQPEFGLLLAWNLKDDVIPKLRAQGFRGRFIVPNPVPAII